MKKSVIATYFGTVIIGALSLILTLFASASEIEKRNRERMEALVQTLANVERKDFTTLKSSLQAFLSNDALLTLKNRGELKIHWQSKFAATGDSLVWIIVFGLPFMVILCLVLVPTAVYKLIVVPQSLIISDLNIEKQRYQSMQMFAHDIRKPFSALKALLDILSKKSNKSSMEALLEKLLPEVDSLLAHVDGMITNLIHGNRAGEKNPLASVCSLDKILDAAVSESAKKHPNSVLPIYWNLQHNLKPNGSEKALVRCFSNLICNAIEAVSPQEKLWIKSRDSKINGEQAVEVTIGNSGRPIPKEILTELFNPFFTSGKSDGTGLGLAYVKKTLGELGGYAAVRSEDARGTEFTLTIPALALLDKVTRSLRTNINVQSGNAVVATSSNTHLKILVVEDQQIYAESLKAAAKECSERGFSNKLDHAKTYAEAISSLERDVFDLVICDIDLRSNEGNGIDIIKFLKSKKSNTEVFIYSNKSLTLSEQRFVEVASNGTLQKPANAHELQQVLVGLTTCKSKRPVVAIIDDDCFVRELWSMQHDVIDTHLFASPEEFLLNIANEPTFIEKFDVIILDYYFAEGSAYTGDKVAKKIRALAKTPIIIASDVQSLPAESLSLFNGRIGKDRQSWDDVQKLVNLSA